MGIQRALEGELCVHSCLEGCPPQTLHLSETQVSIAGMIAFIPVSHAMPCKSDELLKRSCWTTAAMSSTAVLCTVNSLNLNHRFRFCALQRDLESARGKCADLERELVEVKAKTSELDTALDKTRAKAAADANTASDWMRTLQV